jgi:hypothetical protein
LGASQDDQRKCEEVLDCWLAEDCGPSDSCAGNDAVCGQNTLGVSPVAFDYAEPVYEELCGG